MGLNVKLYNIVSDGSYVIRYKSGSNPYPVETDSSFTTVGTYSTSTTSVTIEDLEFDTQYWVKMTDVTTGRYIVKNIYTHDSKAFPCYDTMCFDVDVECEGIAATPTPTITITPTQTITPTITPTPDALTYYQVDLVSNTITCDLEGSPIYVTFNSSDPTFLGGTPTVNDWVTLAGPTYTGCWEVLAGPLPSVASATSITAINFGNCRCAT